MATDHFLRMPKSLDSDEIPFVIGFMPDSRQKLVENDIGFRRGEDRFTIEHIVDGDLRARAFGLNLDGSIYVGASAGPLLKQWLPLLEAFPADSLRPVLSSTGATKRVVMAGIGLEIKVSLFSFPDSESVLALYRVGDDSSFNDENVAICIALSLPVIKTALLAISEYPTLVDEVPDANVSQGDLLVPLGTVIEVSGEIASRISWQHKP